MRARGGAVTVDDTPTTYLLPLFRVIATVTSVSKTASAPPLSVRCVRYVHENDPDSAIDQVTHELELAYPSCVVAASDVEQGSFVRHT